MGSEAVDIRVRLQGARVAASEAKQVGGGIRSIGRAAEKTDRQSRKMGRGFVYTKKSIGGLHAGVSGLSGALGFGAGLGLIGAFKVMNDEARDAVKTNRSTAAVLKSTGGAANVSQGHVYKLGQRLGELAAVDNQIVQKGENMLLTFRDIRNEAGKGNKIFDRTAKAALNLSAGFEAAGKSMSPTDAALQLGKAVNDPVKGMTRLQRIGVTFTKQQTDQVAAMTKAGDKLGAQKVILNEINKEFGGQARSQADPMKRLGVIFKDVAETLGLKLLPYIDKGARALGKWVKQVAAGTGQGGRFRDKLEHIWKDGIKPVAVWLGHAAKRIFDFVSAHPDLAKIAGSLLIARKAINLMHFGSAIKGVGGLIGALKRAAALRTGETIANGLAISLGQSKMQTLGSKAGSSLGAALGKAAGPIAVAIIGYELYKHLHKQVEDAVQGHGGPGTISIQDLINGPMKPVAHPKAPSPIRGRGTYGPVRTHSGPTPSGGHHGPGSRPKRAVTPGALSGLIPSFQVPVTLMMPDGKVLAQATATATNDSSNRR